MEKIVTLNIKQVAELKGCSRQTVHNNIDKLNRSKDNRVIWDKKLDDWNPGTYIKKEKE